MDWAATRVRSHPNEVLIDASSYPCSVGTPQRRRPTVIIAPITRTQSRCTLSSCPVRPRTTWSPQWAMLDASATIPRGSLVIGQWTLWAAETEAQQTLAFPIASPLVVAVADRQPVRLTLWSDLLRLSWRRSGRRAGSR